MHEVLHFVQQTKIVNDVLIKINTIIGASLSEPHTSRFGVCMYVCVCVCVWRVDQITEIIVSKLKWHVKGL